jgi:iron complex outermembrane receptor protein
MTRQHCCFIFLATEYVVAHVLSNHPHKKEIKYQLTLNNTKMKTKITTHIKPLLIALLLGISNLIHAQISGNVASAENNKALSSATITEKNTNNSTAADTNGNFTLQSNATYPLVLVVSFVGYETTEYTVKSSEDKINIKLVSAANQTGEVKVTARRRNESAQEVPIALTVVGGKAIEDQGNFNVNRLKEAVPSVQLYSSNPRNTGLNIRGTGSPFGLTNDGLDPGVGYYVDGVYFARPAATTLDFLDVEKIEVLRGPQGTLFGKNTTSGAFNITTAQPSFKAGSKFEVSYGNFGYVQAKSSITGPLGKKVAARVAFSGTQRDGLIENVNTRTAINDINNLGIQGKLLWQVAESTSVTLSADATRQRPNGYAQVLAGVVTTERAAYRQFSSIIKDLNYTPVSYNAFDRKIDHDTPWNSHNDLGGVSLNVNSKIGKGTLTSTSAYRYWNWGPSNDRDFTGLQALAKSQNPSEQTQLSQEFRYAGEFSENLSGVAGLFYLNQTVETHGTEESGKDQWRFAKSSTSNLWTTAGLFDGYGIKTESSIKSQSAAAFANVDWRVFKVLHIQPGVRYNYDQKEVSYDRKTYGGLQTSDAALIKLQQGVYSNQKYTANADEKNFTYSLTLAYQPNKRVNAFATYATGFKPVGVNVAGLPSITGSTLADTTLAVIKPENVTDIQFGLKLNPINKLTINIAAFRDDIKDYQTNVQSPELGVNRGYIANAEKVRVQGAELDVRFEATKNFTFSGALAYTDGKYVKFTNAPLPLEETGHTENGKQVAFKDISGGSLAGISKFAGSISAEATTNDINLLGRTGKLFIAVDGFGRSGFSSSPSPSKYLNIAGYVLVNGRVGFKASDKLSISLWGRNILDKDYFEQLLPAGGNAGHFAAVLGDQRTYGVTFRQSF